MQGAMLGSCLRGLPLFTALCAVLAVAVRQPATAAFCLHRMELAKPIVRWHLGGWVWPALALLLAEGPGITIDGQLLDVACGRCCPRHRVFVWEPCPLYDGNLRYSLAGDAQQPAQSVHLRL